MPLVGQISLSPTMLEAANCPLCSGGTRVHRENAVELY
jgi:hypothetical protein